VHQSYSKPKVGRFLRHGVDISETLTGPSGLKRHRVNS